MVFCRARHRFRFVATHKSAAYESARCQRFAGEQSAASASCALLRAACYDCHSSETHWPWYARVAPMSWLIASDVKEGREHLNLSDWPNDNPMRAAKRRENMSDEVGSGEMPLPKYANWLAR